MLLYVVFGTLLGLALAYLYQRRKALSPKRFADAISLNDYDYLLDVRTPDEWKQGHHPKAILMPIGTFVTDLPAKITNKRSKILLYCKKGIRAQAATQIAHRLGYDNVRYLDGTYEQLRAIKE